MKNLLIIPFIFVCTIANAEFIVCQNGDTLRTVQADCRSIGLCSGFNNEGIDPKCIIATDQEWGDSKLPNKKLNKSIVSGNRIINMTQSEIDVIAQSKADAQALAETNRLKALDDAITDTDISGVRLQRIETIIDNLGDMNDVKRFLKRLVRYISTIQSMP